MDDRIPSNPSTEAFRLLAGFINSYILSALIRNNVIESLGSGPKTNAELSKACGLNQNVLFRTLRFAAFIGIVIEEEDRYVLTELGRCFLMDVPGSLYRSADFITAPPWRDSWIHFEHCLKTGEPAFNHIFDQPFFGYLDQHQEYGKPFHQYMSGLTKMMAPLIPANFDFSGFKKVCDVGGGQGILLKAILAANPHLKGILFDIESVMNEHVLEETADRVTLVNGNFFDEVPEADCMVLKTIIHDWNDANSVKILSNCQKSLVPGGRILLIEQVIEEPFTLNSIFYDLHMQVMLGGSERTREEFRDLLKAAGLQLIRIISTPSPMCIIEAGV